MSYYITKFNDTIPFSMRSLISARYKSITKAINNDYWNIQSDSKHSRYVGSYGRGTAIKTSDIDILVELPLEEFSRFDNYKNNGQSKLLQSVKTSLVNIYPRTKINADGQIIKVDFSDGIMFEILPAFVNYNNIFIYPDTNTGGKWLSTNPKAEQLAIKDKNLLSNTLLIDTCKHIRYIRDNFFSSYHLSGIIIDSFIYHIIDNWRWLNEGEQSTVPLGSYENHIKEKLNFLLTNNIIYDIKAPGSQDPLPIETNLTALIKVIMYLGN